MWGGILVGWNSCGVEFHVGWSTMWVKFYVGWKFHRGILCGVEFHSKWGGMSKIVILYDFFQFSEILAEKRIAPLNSSIPDGSESLTMLGSFSALPWSCIKSRNLAGDTWTLNPLSLLYLVFYVVLIIFQSIGMVLHRWQNMVIYSATANINKNETAVRKV